jgi:hypothetical protein
MLADHFTGPVHTGDSDMTKPLTDLRNVACGLLLGVADLRMGQAPAAHQTSPRYQITAIRNSDGNLEFVILDHETNKVYQKPGFSINRSGTTVEELLKR